MVKNVLVTSDETAVFAMGNFWEPQDFFGQLQGVVDVQVGYTGGTSSNPTYHTIGDHSEAVKIEFDPYKISYEELLRYFWEQHDPTAEYEPQFKSAIFYMDDVQRQTAQDSKRAEQEKHEDPIVTEILPLAKFYPAEAYQQDYLRKLRGEL